MAEGLSRRTYGSRIRLRSLGSGEPSGPLGPGCCAGPGAAVLRCCGAAVLRLSLLAYMLVGPAALIGCGLRCCGCGAGGIVPGCGAAVLGAAVPVLVFDRIGAGLWCIEFSDLMI